MGEFNEPSWRERHNDAKVRKHGGRAALATIVGFDERFNVAEGHMGDAGATNEEHYSLTLRVEPDDESPFEARLREHRLIISSADRPKVGDRIAVLYNPRDHSEVVRDLSIEGRMALNQAIHPGGSDPAVSPMATVGASVDELERLTLMHASGALTDEEFATAKRRILGPGSTAARENPPQQRAAAREERQQSPHDVRRGIAERDSGAVRPARRRTETGHRRA